MPGGRWGGEQKHKDRSLWDIPSDPNKSRPCMYMCKGIHEEGHPGSWYECSYRGLDTAHYFTDYCNYFDKDCVEISIRRINVAVLRRTGKARGKGPLGGCEFWVQWMTQETKKVPGDRC